MTEAERFWGYVDKSAGETACWPWRGGIGGGGYGNFWVEGRTARATHVAMRLVGRDRPDLPGYHRAVCRHSCDRPECVNPSHLSWGTQLDNVQDGLTRGRHVRGAQNKGGEGRRGRPGLSEAQVREMKVRLAAGERQTALAAAFEVTQAMVSLIATGRKWAHVGVVGPESQNP